jgi:hypothetical protein
MLHFQGVFKMPNDYTLLKNNNPQFNLDIAILLAEASAAAYTQVDAFTWATQSGFDAPEQFNIGNIQGFWCVKDDVALLAFRGTSNPGQWIRDAQILPAGHPWGWVHKGFGDGVEAVADDLQRFTAAAKAIIGVKLWVTGHSLGGALSVIAAANLKIDQLTPTVYTYGQPRAGFGEFAGRFNRELPGRLYRFINQSDIVARVPPDPFYRHTGIPKHIVIHGAVPGVALAAANPALAAIVALPPAVEDIQADEITLSQEEPASVTPEEFSRLQGLLGARAEALGELPEEPPFAAAEAQLAGALPIFEDHAIREYIRLLKEIQALPR